MKCVLFSQAGKRSSITQLAMHLLKVSLLTACAEDFCYSPLNASKSHNKGACA